MREITIARWNSKVDKTSTCWNWTGARLKSGYGLFKMSGTNQLAHRIAFENSSDDIIPAGMVVRHKCDNPSCVNPAHLELGTQAENVQDKMGRGRHSNGRKERTHCSKGHEFSEKNIYLYKGNRYCRACMRESTERKRAAKRIQSVVPSPHLSMIATRTVSRRRTLAAPVAFTMRVDSTIRGKALYVAEQTDESLAKAVRRFLLDYIAAYEAQHGAIPVPAAQPAPGGTGAG